ncbi:MAG: peptide chain release factor N(5)-glutamine methyltransferase [Bacteroidota bacterium]|nr:peptide chain release factor N(5)-glutamine methyltransferase [Bacteroidota bacterium]
MRIASNKFGDVARFFHEELHSIYDKSEIDVFVDLCFETYLGYKRTERILRASEPMSESVLLKFNAAVKELKNQVPLQYILGRADFYRLEFLVNQHVLIPRPETEELVDLIIKNLKRNKRTNVSILDIGTGSGCIAISLKKNLTGAEVSAIDISTDALDIAKRNALLNNVSVNWIESDILSGTFPLKSPVDIIVSNPPYVCASEKDQMGKNVLEHEPHLALFVDDNDPLLFYRKIADLAMKNLSSGAEIYFEINPLQDLQMKDMMVKKGFRNVVLIKDMNDKNRILHCSV